jgi:hypothetical protein
MEASRPPENNETANFDDDEIIKFVSNLPYKKFGIVKYPLFVLETENNDIDDVYKAALRVKGAKKLIDLKKIPEFRGKHGAVEFSNGAVLSIVEYYDP